MSNSPATPDHGGKRIMEMLQPAEPCTEKLSTTGRLKQAALQEPSPASTYGNSAANSSTPTTPQDAITDMTEKLRAAQLDNSPTSNYTFVVQLSDTQVSEVAKALSSPTKSSKDDAGHRASSNGSSPSHARINAIRNSPTWRGPSVGSFVRQSGNNADDPFTANTNTVTTAAPGTSGSSYRVREDRIGESPTASTAQAHFGPEACVFVANLLQTATDQQLEQAVTAKFSEFGRVYVKIRRDLRGMPFAFAQYENENQAQTAVTSGRNLEIMGRGCRTEIAKANRTLYLSRIAGGHISAAEGREILTGYGAIEDLFHATPTDRTLYSLPLGIFARWHYYDDCRDAQLKFRSSDSYRLEQVRIPEEMRTANILRSGSSRRRFPSSAIDVFSNASPNRWSPQSSTGMDHATRYSIFVGNLPPIASEQGIYDHFINFGNIRKVTLCLKPTTVELPNQATFCFVEFNSPEAADYAVQRASRWYHGFRIRVEHKVVKRHAMSPVGSSASPGTPMTAATWQTLVFLYQRGIQAGLSQASQSQTMPAQSMMPQPMPAPVYGPYPSYFPMFDESMPMYGGPSPVPVTYGHGSQSFDNHNVATALNQPQYPQQASANPYVQYNQPQEQISTSGHHREPPYQWPLPSGDNVLSAQSDNNYNTL